MKKVKQEITLEVWKCDVCGKVYDFDEGAMECEKRHDQENCKHKNLGFELSWYDDDEISCNKIEVYCKDCKAYFGEKYISKEDSEKIRKAAKRVFFESQAVLETPDRWKHLKKPACLLQKNSQK
jgi:hypothetical protein